MMDMQKLVNRIFRFLYDKWYGSPSCILVLLAISAGLDFYVLRLQCATPEWLVVVANVFGALLSVAVLNGLVAFVVALFRKRWNVAVAQFAAGFVLVIVFVFLSFGLMVHGMFSTEPDHFADGLKMPKDIKVETPTDYEHARRTGAIAQAQDKAYVDAMTKAALDPLSSRGKITCDISALDQLCKGNRDLLIRYLASHRGWDLKQGRTGLIAWRSAQIDLPTPVDENSINQIIACCNICLDDFDGMQTGAIRCKSGEQVKVRLERKFDSMKRCEVVCVGNNLSLDVSEASPFTASRILQPTFDFVGKEFAALKEAGDWSGAKKLLPSDSIKMGSATFDVYAGFQGGIYNYEAWVNPGEPGEVYVRAYEVTKGTRLSESRMKQASRQCVGWSDCPDEKFFAASGFTIYEGDWGAYYAARIELWFVPANCGDERKLAERVYRVDGWER